MNLADPAVLKTFLARHGLVARKGLGQHFLVSHKIVDAIMRSLEGVQGILEIGPGPGVLTSPMSELAERLIAVEIDVGMINALKESSPNADVRKVNALESSLGPILLELPEPRAVVSNLPYYITGPLLTRIAESRTLIVKAVVMMQKEVAERVVAVPKTSARGSLSVFLQSQFSVRTVAKVPAGSFLPPPKVDSTVLELTPRPMSVAIEDEVGFFKLIRFGFAQPRKTLANNLLAGYRLDRGTATSVVELAGLGERARPQELDESEWVRVQRALAEVSDE